MLASELRDVGNDYAHSFGDAAFDANRTHEALDTMARPLSAIGATAEASAVLGLSPRIQTGDPGGSGPEALYTGGRAADIACPSGRRSPGIRRPPRAPGAPSGGSPRDVCWGGSVVSAWRSRSSCPPASCTASRASRSSPEAGESRIPRPGVRHPAPGNFHPALSKPGREITANPPAGASELGDHDRQAEATDPDAARRIVYRAGVSNVPATDRPTRRTG